MQENQKQITVWIDGDIRNEIRPFLVRDGLSLSSFIRKAMADYLESRKSRNAVISITELDALDDIEARR